MNKLPIADHIPYIPSSATGAEVILLTAAMGSYHTGAHTSTELDPNASYHPAIPPIRTSKEWKK
jgi:hypothetical protein